jgi:hypothetical protein
MVNSRKLANAVEPQIRRSERFRRWWTVSVCTICRRQVQVANYPHLWDLWFDCYCTCSGSIDVTRTNFLPLICITTAGLLAFRFLSIVILPVAPG